MSATSSSCSALRLLFLVVCCIEFAHAEDLTLRRAIDLAMAHSNTMAIAAADQQHAHAVYREANGAFIPQVIVGSGVGYAYGFPLSLEGSAPTVFNITGQWDLLNQAQREFISAAKTEWNSSAAQTRDTHDKVLLDVVATYCELNKWERKLPILYAERKVTRDMQSTARERVKEGVDAPVEETKVKLKAAQSNLRLVQAEGSADTLRRHLADLTGIPAQSIATVTSSIPPLPEVKDAHDDESVTLDSMPAIESANLRAEAERLRARGEHKALHMTVDAALQYGVINETLTNYQQFFQPGTFRRNNVTVGLVIRFPILNASQRARAAAADADALSARKQAENAKGELSSRIAKLRNTVRQSSAAHDVAQVQYELALAQLESAKVRMQSQTAPLRELQDASLQAVEYSGGLMDSELDLERTQLQLLLATGQLQNWSNTAR
jgi:outer membrane protein TolC